MKLYKILFALLAFTMLLGSCKKYEDGLLFSFKTKQDRIINSWKYDKVYRNGLNVVNGAGVGSLNYASSSIGFNDEGRFSAVEIIIEDNDTTSTFRYDGSWECQEKDTELKLTYDAPSTRIQTLRITNLRSHRLWLQESFDDNLYEYQLVNE